MDLMKQKRGLSWARNEQHQQRNKSQCDTMQKASPRCRETQETHINTQYNYKKVANNVTNEIKQKRVVTSEKSTTSTKKQVVTWCDAMQLAERLAKVHRDKKINKQLHQPAAVIVISNADMFKVQAGKGEMPVDNKNDCGTQQCWCDTMLF